MPILANRIVFGTDPEDPGDYFPFEDMRGRLQPKAEQLERFARPGHRGETLRKTGIRAFESKIVTVHYVLDWTAAKDALVAYNELADGDLVQIIQYGENFGYFRVVEPVVELPDTRACASVVNSVLESETGLLPTVMQYCGWTVISTDAPEA